MRDIIRAIYPAQCVSCAAPTELEHSLCSNCWPGVHFIGGTQCLKCSNPLPGDDDGEPLICDDCLQTARPWEQGRAAIRYKDVGRRLVLGLKHGDRTDFLPSMSQWMCAAGKKLNLENSVLVPVPLHRSRLFRRKFNQAAELAKGVAKLSGAQLCLDGLVRTRATKSLDHKSKEERFAILADAIAANPKRATTFIGRPIVLIDDVMTSGATLAACTEALERIGAENVSILVLARVVKDT